MVLSSISGVTSPITTTEMPKVENNVTESSVVRVIGNKEVENMMSTEQYVRKYFADIPIMIQVARCESQFRHLDSDGEIRRGIVNPADVGVMQINEHYHLDRSKKANYDIYTIEGNTAYARELYEDKGTAPWNSSKPCWGKYLSKDALAMSTK